MIPHLLQLVTVIMLVVLVLVNASDDVTETRPDISPGPPYQHHQEQQQLWAGYLTFTKPGIANRVRLNITVTATNSTENGSVKEGNTANSAASAAAVARANWIFTHDSHGGACVPHVESELRWTQTPGSGNVSAIADPNNGGFYSFYGHIKGDALSGQIVAPHQRQVGEFVVQLNADPLPPDCHHSPSPPPPPPPSPPTPLPASSDNSSVWPMPKVLERTGANTWWIAGGHESQFEFAAEPGSGSMALTAAFERYRTLCFPHKTPLVQQHPNQEKRNNGVFHSYHNTLQQSAVDATLSSPPPPPLRRIVFTIKNPNATVPHLGIDESYNISLPGDANGEGSGGGDGVVSAVTVIGAYRALATLSQLLRFDYTVRAYKVVGVPLFISDAPRFAWRELMVDTARHWLPMPSLRRVVDGCEASKLNTLHLHLVDSQAFPLVLPSRPQLVRGAYSSQERYTMADLAELAAYGAARGVRIVPEIDTPGHAASWCVGMPEMCPAAPKCTQPLDPSKNATFATIRAILQDLLRALPDTSHVHLGGDEVDTSCWDETPHVAAWMREHGLDTDSAYGYFVQQTQATARDLGRIAVVWDEVYNHFGTQLDSRHVVINTRFNAGQAPARTPCVANATAHGFSVVRSPNKHWYLDQTIHKPWTTQYDFEPCGDLPTAAQCANILGGAASMWGETVDVSDFENTIWPRAGAVAERLWSPRKVNDSARAAKRFAAYRCYLNSRIGLAAAPAFNGMARAAPKGPGSCFLQ